MSTVEQQDGAELGLPEQEGDQDVAREKTPREKGRERIENVGKWFKGFADGARDKLSAGWGFAKKVGGKIGEGSVAALEHVMGSPDYAVGAGKAVAGAAREGAKATGEFVQADIRKTGEHVGIAKDAVVGVAVAGAEKVYEGYQHVSEGIKLEATETWEDMQEAYRGAIEIKDRVVEAGHQKIDQVMEAGNNTREALVSKFKNWQTKREAEKVMKERAAAVARIDQEIAKKQSTSETATRLLERAVALMEANSQAVDQLKAQRQQLVESQLGSKA